MAQEATAPAASVQAAPASTPPAQPAQTAPQPAAPQPAVPTQVTVTGHRADVSNRIDRKVYDIAHDPDAQTGVAGDVLGKLPAVQVTPTGGVTLRGDGNVTVLVDGKYPPQGNQVVLTLSAADIDRIEVMTNPSAQYAPDGTAGIINIITRKRHPFGINGNANLRASSQGQVNGGLNASLTEGPWSLDGRFSVGHNPQHNSNSTVRSQPEDVHEDGTYRGQSENMLTGLTATYKLSELSTFSLGGYFFRLGLTGFAAESYRSTTLNFDGTAPNSFNLSQSDLEAIYTYQNDKTGSHFTLDADRTGYRQTERGVSTDRYTAGGTTITGEVQQNHGPEDDIKGDYEHHYASGHELTAGFEWDHRRTENSTDYSDSGSVPGPVANGFRDAFDVDRSVASAYITYQTSFGAWTVMPGLRAELEHRRVTSSAVTARVSDLRWYPSLHIDHPLGDGEKLKLSYSRGVQRPDVASYDPGASFIGLVGETTGNPYLKPTDTDSFEAEYDRVKANTDFEATLFYRANNGLFAQVTTARPDGYLITQPINAGNSHTGGVELTWKGPLAKGWKYSLNTTVSDTGLTRIGEGNRDYLSALGNGMIEYDGQGGDQYQANLTLTGRSYMVQGYTGASYRIDLSYQHPLTKAVALVASVSDLTNSQRTVVVIDQPGLKSREVRMLNGQALRVGLTYKFGTAKR